MARTPESGVVELCGVQGCCPKIDFTDPAKVVITDDLGGRVELARPEWEELKTKFGATSEQL